MKAVTWNVYYRWYDRIINLWQSGQYTPVELGDMIRSKHCTPCNNTYGCNYCSIYAMLSEWEQLEYEEELEVA